MTDARAILALDVGEKKIGLALAHTGTTLAVPYGVVYMNDAAIDNIKSVVQEHHITDLVVGLPRGLEGQNTAQTAYARAFAQRLENFGLPVHFQDEALTSRQAEATLKGTGKPYKKEDIDALAACIFLQDFIDEQARAT